MLTKYDKFLVALVMAGVQFVRAHYGVDLGIGETEAATLVNLIAAALVYAIPNKAA